MPAVSSISSRRSSGEAFKRRSIIPCSMTVCPLLPARPDHSRNAGLEKQAGFDERFDPVHLQLFEIHAISSVSGLLPYLVGNCKVKHRIWGMSLHIAYPRGSPLATKP